MTNSIKIRKKSLFGPRKNLCHVCGGSLRSVTTKHLIIASIHSNMAWRHTLDTIDNWSFVRCAISHLFVWSVCMSIRWWAVAMNIDRNYRYKQCLDNDGVDCKITLKHESFYIILDVLIQFGIKLLAWFSVAYFSWFCTILSFF